jgi:SAM-dependent methyltransferase
LLVVGSESISYDRLADCYDATRGGLKRGRGFAADIAPWCGVGPVLEIGIGTGAIALPLRDLLGASGVVGIDVSPAMLASAKDRLGAVVAVGDGECLPVRSRAIGTVVLVWMLHLAADPERVLGECRRILARQGRVVVVSGQGKLRRDDIEHVSVDLTALVLGGRPDAPDRVRELAEEAGLRLVHEALTAEQSWTESPAQLVELLERRQFGVLFDLDDERWNRLVQPQIDALRALPDPDRPRWRVGAHPILVFEHP